jgi:putative heme iron utilization protein
MLTGRQKELRATLIELCQEEGKRALVERLLAQAAEEQTKEPIRR